MLIFPAIDLYDGKAVRLYKGDYQQMTVYHQDPTVVAQDFCAQGATCMHLVDLEGAKFGTTPNLKTVAALVKKGPALIEVGGGIRDLVTVQKYLDVGVSRVILGTAALTDPAFLERAVAQYGEKIAVGVDLKDGKVATHGWTKTSDTSAQTFCAYLQQVGVQTIICTDISRDGAMQGTNHALYRSLSQEFSLQIIASGGVSSMEDILRLREQSLYGAIIGKAYYTGAICLKEAIEVANA